MGVVCFRHEVITRHFEQLTRPLTFAMTLRTTVNSFDLFDTLLVRRALHPGRIFEDVERSLNAKGFAQARKAAEQFLMQRGGAFDLHDIYREITRRSQCSVIVAQQLMTAEIDAEFDHAVPVMENLIQVREGDLVVSDMYLPADVLRRLLHHIGLRTFVHLVVSNGGKRDGSIWPRLCQHWLIHRHLGDNQQADVERPRQHGITGTHYTGTMPSEAERLLATRGMSTLAGIVRALRLRNPYTQGIAEYQLWLCFSQLNLALLCLTAMAIRRLMQEHGRQRVVFSARDGYFLCEIFSLLFPTVPSNYLHVSRQVLANCGADLGVHLDALQSADALIVDLASTGTSWFRFASAHHRVIDLFTLIRIAPYTAEHVAENDLVGSPHLRLSSLLDSRRLGRYCNAIEVINTAPYGSTCRLFADGCTGPSALPARPELVPGHELPPSLVSSLVSAHAGSLDLLRRERSRLLEEMPSATPIDLMETLTRSIIAQELLIKLGAQLSP